MVCFENFREHKLSRIVYIEKFRRHKLGKGKKKNAEISVRESFCYLTVINSDNCLFSNYSYT